MTDDERSSQLSAMFDGELPPAECELLARRLARDEALRRQWSSYALIGAAVRGEPLATRGAAGARADLAARVREALAAPDADAVADDEVMAVAVAGRRPKMPRWAVPLSGAGLAAGIAAAAILWLRTGTPSTAAVADVAPKVRPAAVAEVVVPMPLPPTPAVAQAATGAAEAASAAADSYTVPPLPPEGSGAAPAVLAGGATLANFLVAHSEVSMPMLRRNALSTLVAVPVDPEPPAAAPPPAAPSAAPPGDPAPEPEVRP